MRTRYAAQTNQPISNVCLFLAIMTTAQLLGEAETLENGLARTPPMGWLAWERFVCETDCLSKPNDCIGEKLFKQMATRLSEDGYKQLGYEYVNIDDCWSERIRRPDGELRPEASQFPGGIRELASYVHSLGLKLGIYGDCGTKTCQLFPGQLKNKSSLEGNYFQRDANSFAEWQIDSFKFDGCSLNVSKAAQLCPFMGDSLNKTGRAMLFSCSWPAYEFDEKIETNWPLVVEKCNLWRSFGDIEDSWSSVLSTIDYFVKMQALVVKYHGPGHWFDADQLVIGNYGLSHDEERAQMAIWCIWASPLYMSNDLRKIRKESAKILKNKRVIEVNQDPIGIFGLMVKQMRGNDVQVYVKPVEPIVDSCPSYAVVYLNRRSLGGVLRVSVPVFGMLTNVHEMLVNYTGHYKDWLNCLKSPAFFGLVDLFDEENQSGSGFNYTSLNDGVLELDVNPSGVRMVKLIRLSNQAATKSNEKRKRRYFRAEIEYYRRDFYSRET